MNPHGSYQSLRISLDHLNDAVQALQALSRLIRHESFGTGSGVQGDRSAMLSALVAALFAAQEEVEQEVERLWPTADNEIHTEHDGDALC